MKKELLLICCWLISAVSWAQAPTSGLIAYYPFNGNTNDESGNGRNGGIGGGVTLTTDRYGNPGKAYAFNGTDGAISTGWNQLTGNSARTMSIWFKSSSITTTQFILSWGHATLNNGSILGTYMESGVRYLGFFAYSASSVTISSQEQDQSQFYDNRWHLITYTHDGNTSRLYLDGILQVSRTGVTLNTTSTILTIGALTYSPNFFSGSLDDVRVYNLALTTAEVQQLYAAEAPPPPSAEFAKLGSNRFIHTIGQFNTSVGNMAGNAITTGTGTRNTFMGFQTGRDNTTGSNNTFMGYQAGYTITTGVNNVFLGANANPVGNNAAGLQNTVALGANAKVAISDAIVLGDTLNTNIKVGIGTAAPRYPLDVKGNVNIRKNGAVPGRLIFAGRSSITTDEQDYLVFSGGQKGESGIRLQNLSQESPAAGGASQFLSLDNNGRVGLYQPILAATQVRLQTAKVTDWADFVFSKEYTQMPLSELEQYIEEHQHLPHLPSAQTMNQQGATVSDLIKGLVQTQEEQAKYILELRKENAEIKALLKQILEKL